VGSVGSVGSVGGEKPKAYFPLPFTPINLKPKT
jgi:hypothetical protein